MSVAIILPAFKEAQNIQKLISSILNVLNNPIIIIVDDSPDKETQEKIKEFNNIRYIYRGKKLGRGSAVIEGMREIVDEEKISKIIEMDSDLSHDPSEIPNNIKLFEKNNLDLLISSRYIKGSKIINWTLSRRIFSHLSNVLTRFVLKVPVHDYTNGFRIYSKSAVKQITENCGKIGDGFIILSEILVELYFNNFKVEETNTIWKNRIRGKSNVNISEITNAFFGLFKIYKRKKIIVNKKN